MAKASPPDDEREWEIYRFEARYVGTRKNRAVTATISCTKPGKERTWQKQFRDVHNDNMRRAREWWLAHIRVVKSERSLLSDYSRTYLELVAGRKYADIPQYERLQIRITACRAGQGEGWADVQSLRHETRACIALYDEMSPYLAEYKRADRNWEADALVVEMVQEQEELGRAIALSRRFFEESGLEFP